MSDEIRSMDIGMHINTDTAMGQLEKLNTQLNSLKRQMGTLGTFKGPSFSGTNNSLKSATQHITQTRSEYRKATDEANRFGNAQTRAANKAASLKKVDDRLQGIANTSRKVTAAIGAMAVYSTKKSMDLQDSFKRTNNLLQTGGEKAGEATKNVTKMQRDGAKYSVKYGQSQQSIADGYQELVKRGYTSNQALAAQQTYLQGSIASGDKYSDVVKNAASALEQFGMKSNSVKGMANATKTVVNQMAYSADKTATSFSDLGEALKFAGPDAHGANQSLHETVSTIGELSNYGIEGSQAGTSMRQIYQRLVSTPTKGKAPNALKSIGLSSKDFRDSKNELLPIQDIFKKLSTSMKGMSKTDKGGIYSALFGANASAAAEALGNSYKGVKKLDDEVQKSQKQSGGGYVQRLADKNMKSSLAQWKQLRESVKAISYTFGDMLLPAVNDSMKAFAKLTDKINELPNSQKKLVGWGALAVASIYPVVKVIQTAVKAAEAFQKVKAWAFGKADKNSYTPKHSSKGTTSKDSGGALTGMFSNSIKNNGVKGMLKNSSLMDKATIAGIGADIGYDAVKSIREGVDTKQGGADMWKAGGKTVGGAIGLYLGGPKGALAGAAIGSGIADYLSKTKTVKQMSTAYDKGTSGKTDSSNNGNFFQKTFSNKGMANGFGEMVRFFQGKDMHWKSPKWPKISNPFKKLGDFGWKNFTKTPAFKFLTGKTNWQKNFSKSLKGINNVKVGNPFKNFHPIKWFNSKISGLHPISSIKTKFKGITGIKFSNPFKNFHPVTWLKSKIGGLHPITWIKNKFKGIGNIKFSNPFKNFHPITWFKEVLAGFNPKQLLQDTFKGAGKKVSKIASSIGFATGSGGRYPNGLPSNTNALVNDGNGPEAIILPGKNRHVMLPKGSDIYNSKDTNRAFGVQHFAAGSTKLKTTGKKVKATPVTIDYSKSKKSSKKDLNSISKNNSKTWKSINKNTSKQNKKMTSSVEDTYKKLHKNLNKQTSSINKDWNSNWTGITKDFDRIFGRMDNYAYSGMKAAIKQLNNGFSGIDKALGQFGGNSKVLGTIHYAKGSNGAIDSDQIATLNDATYGPKQEAIIHPNGGYELPKGRNVVHALSKGDTVMNGADTQIAQNRGLLPRYAKGAASKSTLRKLASSNEKDPSKSFGTMFTNAVNGASSKLSKGIANTGKGASKSVGVPWNSAMWTVINNAISGGGAGAGGPVTHSLGAGWGVSSGFGNRGSVGGGYSSHDGVDYSGGKTVHAMNTGTVYGAGGPPSGWGGGNGIGEWVGVGGGGLNYIYQELNGKSSSGAKLLVSKGDQVKAGQAIAVLGPSGTHVHVGATHHKMFSIKGSSTAGWLDPRHVKGTAVKVKKSAKKDTALQKLAKKQLGSKALSWITKNLGESDELGSGGNFSLSGGLASRARALAAAIKKIYPSATNSGIAAVLGNWEFESGLNPGAKNPGGGAYGLGQWLGGRKSNLVRFAKKQGTSASNANTQLMFALTKEGSDSSLLKSVLRGKGSVASLASRFSSGWERGGYTAQHVAGSRKVASAFKHNEHGGIVNKGDTVATHEKGFELFKPNQSGKILPHDKALKAVKGSSGNGNVTIKQNITINAEGNQKVEISKQVKQGTEKANENLIDKLTELLGFNDEGGLII